MSSAPSSAEEDAYFSSNPPPRLLDAHARQAAAFVSSHAAAGRRVVLVTSGGTTVPLERNTVRFIDNFSAGTRGAASAEHFLAAGYAVIFLHREFSLVPYARHFSHATTGSFLDFLTVEDGDDGNGGEKVVRAAEGSRETMARVLGEYKRAREQGLLLTVPFVTIGDYLHELRAISRLMAPLGPEGLLYLAAAVSDFFVPPERMAEHKIQSTDAAAATTNAQQGQQQQQQEQKKKEGEEEEETFDNFDATPRVPRSKRLVIDLDPVPKFLKSLVDGWAPRGMIVSYKLETDPAILVHKARGSLARFQHHLVIGNLLATRKWEVVFVAPGLEDCWLRVARANGGGDGWTDDEGRRLRAGEVPHGEPEREIEALIIPSVRELHDRHVREANAKKAEAA
ncbi:hypothetical protein N3K66_000103 [Trichothecium roseum]|uniref:Uncharacterized protein n=1 Tax=Trichothecium roseum TaxID=47278 RepID=A0ACC0VBA0_9HYPO|nr:hypothetical protein N3K66_000103 [Trichothecium roseum]